MSDRALQIWADAPRAVAEVVEKALAYEEAWTNWSDYTRTPELTEEERILAKAHAHQALMIAVRALKGSVMAEDPLQRWLNVHPLPDRQGRIQQMDYLDGYILALNDALWALGYVSADVKTEPSPAQLGRDVLNQALRRQLAAMLNSARAKLKEIRDPVVDQMIQRNTP